MRLQKVFSITAALLIGAGSTALMADDDRKHRGDRGRNHGGHAKVDQDKRKIAPDRGPVIKKRMAEAKKRAASNSRGWRGPQGGPPTFMREMIQKKMDSARGGRGRGPQGGPPEFVCEMMRKRMASDRSVRGQAGPPQHVIEMWKNRRGAAQRGERRPQARGGFKRFGGPQRGPQARSGNKGPRGSKGSHARGSSRGHRS